MTNRIRVGIIFGGRSGEHEVSLRSAESIMNAIDRRKYEVIPIGITKDGHWLVAGDPLKELKGAAEAERAALTAGQCPPHSPSTASAGLTTASNNGLVPVIQYPGTRIPALDVVFPVLHGPYGEDGTIQGLFELANIPYVGAGVLGSALGMDKVVQKTVFRAHGLPVTDFVVITRREWETDPAAVQERVAHEIGFPCFTKPSNLGSSVGVSKVRDRDGLAAALALAASYDRKILVERAVPQAREIECSVLGNESPIASVCGEVVPHREFYDYRAKYEDESTELIVPAQLPDETMTTIQELACRAFTAVDCAGMARVDFFLSRSTGEIYINEINTIPGFTSVSMYPRLWEASGIPYSDLIDRLITLAIERHREKSRSRTVYTYDH